MTFGVMSEVLLGTTLEIWAGGSSQPLGRDALGSSLSFATVVAVMFLLAAGMVVLATATRLSRAVLLVAVAICAAGFAWGGILAFTVILQDPGIGVLLGCGAAMTFPVLRGITRASGTESGSRTSR